MPLDVLGRRVFGVSVGSRLHTFVLRCCDSSCLFCVVSSKPFVLSVCAVCLRCFCVLTWVLLEVCAGSRETSHGVLVGVLVVERCSRRIELSFDGRSWGCFCRF